MNAEDGAPGSPLFMTPRTQRQSLNITGVPRASDVMTADGSHGNYRQPLGALSGNSYVRSANSEYGMSAGAKAGKQPLRTFASTPRIQRYAEPGDLPMR
jgi:hypothetical protein